MIVTDNAINQLKKILNINEYLRISIQSGGCSGFLKTFKIDNNIEESDIIINENIIIDQISYSFLSNSILDFKKTIMEESWILDIPETSSSCGCGSSFSL